MLLSRFLAKLSLAITLTWIGCSPSPPGSAKAPPTEPGENAIVALSNAPMPERLAAATEGFEGTVSLYAKNLDTGETVGMREDEPVRTASTIKLPIMVAAFRAVAGGTARWDEKIPITPEAKVSGSGVIREFEDNTPLTLRDLVHVMIVVSDNTATNLVLDRLSADYVNETMEQLGFAQTRSMRKIRGDGSQLKVASGWSKEGEKEENKRFGIGRSTPKEMVLLLERLDKGEIVSPKASEEMIAILERQQFKDGIGRAFTGVTGVRVASKSGALDALRSDVGLMYFEPKGGGRKGRLAIAITVDGMPVTDYSPDNKGNLLISKLTGVLVQGLLPAK